MTRPSVARASLERHSQQSEECGRPERSRPKHARMEDCGVPCRPWARPPLELNSGSPRGHLRTDEVHKHFGMMPSLAQNDESRAGTETECCTSTSPALATNKVEQQEASEINENHGCEGMMFTSVCCSCREQWWSVFWPPGESRLSGEEHRQCQT